MSLTFKPRITEVNVNAIYSGHYQANPSKNFDHITIWFNDSDMSHIELQIYMNKEVKVQTYAINWTQKDPGQVVDEIVRATNLWHNSPFYESMSLKQFLNKTLYGEV